jgi:hypothetical protein
MRISLLILLFGLTAVFVSLPRPAEAYQTTGGPNCEPSDAGHHIVYTFPVMGSTSPWCNQILYCKIGNQTFEWDCVQTEGGDVVPQNVVASSPVFCNCGAGPYATKCC